MENRRYNKFQFCTFCYYSVCRMLPTNPTDPALLFKPPIAPRGHWAFPLESKGGTGACWWQDLCYSAGQPRGSCCSKSCSSCVGCHPPALQAVPQGVFLGVPTAFLPCLFPGMPRYSGESL